VHVTVSGLEHARVAAAAPDAVLHTFADLGLHELLGSGLSHQEIDLELASRGAAAISYPIGGRRPGDAPGLGSAAGEPADRDRPLAS
jgi:hypothetical protein